MDEIMNFIGEMSYHQGFYGRLYRDIKELEKNDEESYARLVEELESQNFKDNLDLVMYLEG